ncbi:hypothetical protein [Paraburkholderia sp. SUR17]|uniref:hypothetical protein n=1 Tax=Paraburkholderia sp. SUR17 TaxID=3034358 RepID=UPI00240860FB|nr:hypothetical protein [Paraburkholderia sp. SUR17]WEY37684.1 hypothetical protein P2869_11395 [Paraburkholderia sp. SUR17]
MTDIPAEIDGLAVEYESLLSFMYLSPVALVRSDRSGILMTVLTDISRQIAAERRIQRTESWLTGIYTNVNDFAFFTLDARGRAEAWHPSIEWLTGFLAADVVGQRLDTF